MPQVQAYSRWQEEGSSVWWLSPLQQMFEVERRGRAVFSICCSAPRNTIADVHLCFHWPEMHYMLPSHHPSFAAREPQKMRFNFSILPSGSRQRVSVLHWPVRNMCHEWKRIAIIILKIIANTYWGLTMCEALSCALCMC